MCIEQSLPGNVKNAALETRNENLVSILQHKPITSIYPSIAISNTIYRPPSYPYSYKKPLIESRLPPPFPPPQHRRDSNASIALLTHSANVSPAAVLVPVRDDLTYPLRSQPRSVSVNALPNRVVSTFSVPGLSKQRVGYQECGLRTATRGDRSGWFSVLLCLMT